MRVALVHDYLVQYGGAERVLEALCEIFPLAPIYTLVYDEKLFKKHIRQKKNLYFFFAVIAFFQIAPPLFPDFNANGHRKF